MKVEEEQSKEHGSPEPQPDPAATPMKHTMARTPQARSAPRRYTVQWARRQPPCRGLRPQHHRLQWQTGHGADVGPLDDCAARCGPLKVSNHFKATECWFIQEASMLNGSTRYNMDKWTSAATE